MLAGRDGGVQRRPVRRPAGLARALDRRGDRQAAVAVGLHAAQRLDVLRRVAAVARGRALRRREAVPLFPHADGPGGDAGPFRDVLDGEVVFQCTRVPARVSTRRPRSPSVTGTRVVDAKVTAAGSVGVVRAVAVAIVAVVTGLYVAVRRLLPTVPDWVRVLREADDSTSMDPSTGAVRSVQSAEVVLPADRIDALWAPVYLERLARTYWDFLTRATFGLVRVYYTDRERFVCLLVPGLKLLTFAAPEYEMDASRGVVRWRIASGILVARRGREGDGYLEIDVQRRPAGAPGQVIVHVEVEVANFFPAIASTIGRWFYTHTQSRIHVLVTQAFLHSLARLDLAPSKVGRLATFEEVPDPRDPLPLDRPGAASGVSRSARP